MYLKRALIVNSGPVESIDLTMQFADSGEPRPTVFVGRNGSGKTNVLSIVADALIEGAATHYRDVVANGAGDERPWFRVVGGATLRAGEEGGFSLLQFEDGESRFWFVEKAGTVSGDAVSRLPDDVKPIASWPADQRNTKTFNIVPADAERIYANGVYIYFPASRAEVPHWLNPDSLRAPVVDLRSRFIGRLDKPIFVERGLAETKAWLASVLLDARADFVLRQTAGQLEGIVSNPKDAMIQAMQHRGVWNLMNQVLKTILDKPEARLGWAGRHNRPGLGFVESDGGQFLPLDALSGGQATLFNTFASVLRYGDAQHPAVGAVEGICIIDEIDAHMHVDLQHRAIPQLIKLFPRVQFILSAHSPLLVLGMSNEFPDLPVIDLPSGLTVAAESYSEFETALEALRATDRFNELILERVAGDDDGGLLVLVEGETDPLYLRAAIEALGYEESLKRVEIDWVGIKDAASGQVQNTGVGGLDALVKVLRSNPQLLSRKLLVLYDNDTQRSDPPGDLLHVRSVPSNDANTRVSKGIENLLPESAIADEFWTAKTNDKGNGTVSTTKTLDKMALCEQICGAPPDAVNFGGFRPVLDLIAEVLGRGLAEEVTFEEPPATSVFGGSSPVASAPGTTEEPPPPVL